MTARWVRLTRGQIKQLEALAQGSPRALRALQRADQVDARALARIVERLASELDHAIAGLQSPDEPDLPWVKPMRRAVRQARAAYRKLPESLRR